MIRLRKSIERWGRQLLARVIGWLFKRPSISAPQSIDGAILVIRTDVRLGNAIMLTPVLVALRQRFPHNPIHLLAAPGSRAVFAQHPCIDRLWTYRKRALLHRHGPLGTLWRLRQQRFGCVIDAANPTDPSTTQAFLARLSGASYRVGPEQPNVHYLYNVAVPPKGTHEIDLRLSVIEPLVGSAPARLCLPTTLGMARRQICPDVPYVVLNIGARLVEKRLRVEDYVAVVRAMQPSGARVVLTYGPSEEPLARAIAHVFGPADDVAMAPPTDVEELAALFRGARAVVSCDTGPMHLAVALGTPTCGLFVSTSLERYGYTAAPHAALRAQHGHIPTAELVVWLTRTVCLGTGRSA